MSAASRFAILVIALGAEPASAQIPGIQLPPGFVVSEFAGDDLAHDIYTMTIDARGRVFVAGRGYIRQLIDDNGDGRLADDELRHLHIWRDRNQNGVTDPDEVQTLAAWGIVSLSYAHEIDEGPLVAAVAQEGVSFRDGSTRPTFDVWLRRW